MNADDEILESRFVYSEEVILAEFKESCEAEAESPANIPKD